MNKAYLLLLILPLVGQAQKAPKPTNDIPPIVDVDCRHGEMQVNFHLPDRTVITDCDTAVDGVDKLMVPTKPTRPTPLNYKGFDANKDWFMLMGDGPVEDAECAKMVRKDGLVHSLILGVEYTQTCVDGKLGVLMPPPDPAGEGLSNLVMFCPAGSICEWGEGNGFDRSFGTADEGQRQAGQEGHTPPQTLREADEKWMRGIKQSPPNDRYPVGDGDFCAENEPICFTPGIKPSVVDKAVKYTVSDNDGLLCSGGQNQAPVPCHPQPHEDCPKLFCVDPVDVPPVTVEITTLPDGGNLIDPHLTCADPTRFLMQSIDGKQHCIRIEAGK